MQGASAADNSNYMPLCRQLGALHTARKTAPLPTHKTTSPPERGEITEREVKSVKSDAKPTSRRFGGSFFADYVIVGKSSDCGAC